MAGIEASAEKILSLSFNQDNTCFAVGTTRGFRVYATMPLALRFRRDWDAGIGIAELYKRSNMIALVGGGVTPRDSENKVIFWDDYSERNVAELDFQSRVCGLRFREERLFIALEHTIFVYTLTTLKHLTTCSTSDNPIGLCCINQTLPLVAVFPGQEQGHLTIWREEEPSATGAAPAAAAGDVDGAPPAAAAGGSDSSSGGAAAGHDAVQKDISAHNGDLACVAVSADGTLVATASDKGTLVRVWETATGNQVEEFRRGTENAKIWSMAFSPDNALLAVTSNHGTCHVFRIKGENKTSALNMLGGIFSSKWSALKANVTEQRSVVSFLPDSRSVVVVGFDGSFSVVTISDDKKPEAKIDSNVSTPSFML